jgi:hypothetical protein
MTLIFGNLVQSFIVFGMKLSEAKSGNATAQAELPAAAAAFRHRAANDAAILVYIGELIRTRQMRSNFLIGYRYCHVVLHFRVYVNLGTYW